MMFYPIGSFKKALLDSNHLLNLSWPYKFRYFLDRSMLIVRSNFRIFENARSLMAGYSRSSPKPQNVFFYVFMPFYPILVRHFTLYYFTLFTEKNNLT